MVHTYFISLTVPGLLTRIITWPQGNSSHHTGCSVNTEILEKSREVKIIHSITLIYLHSTTPSIISQWVHAQPADLQKAWAKHSNITFHHPHTKRIGMWPVDPTLPSPYLGLTSDSWMNCCWQIWKWYDRITSKAIFIPVLRWSSLPSSAAQVSYKVNMSDQQPTGACSTHLLQCKSWLTKWSPYCAMWTH